MEIALYNMFSYLYEIETGEEYKMSRKNDIYSGLGKNAQNKVDNLEIKEGEEEPLIEDVKTEKNEVAEAEESQVKTEKGIWFAIIFFVIK